MKNTTTLKATKNKDMNTNCSFVFYNINAEKSRTHEEKMEDPGTGTNRDAAPGAP